MVIKLFSLSAIPIYIIVLLIIVLSLAMPVNAYTLNDWFELEKKPTEWKCDAPLVEGIKGFFCNTTQTPIKFSYDKSCLGKSWDFTKSGLPISEASEKVGGFNHYKYCVNEITLKNPTIDFLSSTDFTYRLSDMKSGVKRVKFLIANPENPNELIEWKLTHTINWDAGLSFKVYAYGEKYDKKDTIEWDFNLTYKPTGMSFYQDPFWDGAAGDQSHVTLVPDNNFWVEDWEGWTVGTEGTGLSSHYTEVSPWDYNASNFTVSSAGGNQFINVTRTTQASPANAFPLLRANNGLYNSLGRNLTMYVKMNAVSGESEFWTAWHNSGNGQVYLNTNLADYEGLYHYMGDYLPKVRIPINLNTWYYTAFNRTANGTNDGSNYWLGGDDDGSGDWDLGYNTSVNVVDTINAAVYRLQAPGVNSEVRWDNFFITQIPDYDYNDNAVTNLSCPFLYSDAENNAINTQTVQFFRNNTLWQTLHNTAPNSSNRGWSVNITVSGGDYTFDCNATACDSGNSCGSTPKSNIIFIHGTNTAPIIDLINLSSSLSFNTSSEDLIGDFNWSDADGNPQSANQTYWWRDNALQNALENLTRVDDGNTSIGNVWIFSARVKDDVAWSDWKNSSSLTVVSNVPNATSLSLTSTDPLNYTNGTLVGSHGFSSPMNNAWLSNSTKWYSDGVEMLDLANLSRVESGNTTFSEWWIYSASVQDNDSVWSLWYNSTNLTIVDFTPIITTPSLNASGYYTWQDVRFNFTVTELDNQAVNVSLNITNNNLNIFTQSITNLDTDITYTSNLTHDSYNQTQVINISVVPSNTQTGVLRNSTFTIQSITISVSDAWLVDVNETSGMGYHLNFTEDYGYPYDINYSIRFYRGSLSYTPTQIEYRNATTNLTRYNVTLPTPLVDYNYTNLSSRWEYNYSIIGGGKTNYNSTSRNQTVWHSYFLTDFFTFPTLLLETEKFLARINYSNYGIASVSNATFELSGLNFSASLNGTTQFYHNQIYTTLLPDSLNTTSYTLQARINFTHDGIEKARNKNTSLTFEKMIITQCGSTTNTTTHVFKSYNETYPTTNMSTSLKINYDTFKIREGLHRNQSYESLNSWNHTFCIYPSGSSFKADTIMTYDGSGSALRTYYHYDLALSNTTTTTNLYSIDEGIDTPLNIYIYDQDDKPISNAYILLLRYYPEESLYRTVQVSLTDADGRALVKLKILDAFYKLIIERSGVVLDQTDKAAYINTDYIFRLNLLPDILDSFKKVDKLSYYLNKNNATGTFTFYWNDAQSIIRTACLEVVQRTSHKDTRLYYQCTNASLGTLSHQINTSVEGRYLAKGRINTNTNYTEYFLETAEILIENVSGSLFKLFGVFLAVILFITLSTVGFSNPASALALGGFAIIISVALQIISLEMATITVFIISIITLIYLIRT